MYHVLCGLYTKKQVIVGSYCMTGIFFGHENFAVFVVGVHS